MAARGRGQKGDNHQHTAKCSSLLAQRLECADHTAVVDQPDAVDREVAEPGSSWVSSIPEPAGAPHRAGLDSGRPHLAAQRAGRLVLCAGRCVGLAKAPSGSRASGGRCHEHSAVGAEVVSGAPRVPGAIRQDELGGLDWPARESCSAQARHSRSVSPGSPPHSMVISGNRPDSTLIGCGAAAEQATRRTAPSAESPQNAITSPSSCLTLERSASVPWGAASRSGPVITQDDSQGCSLVSHLALFRLDEISRPTTAPATTSRATAAASGTGVQPGIETAGSDAAFSHVHVSKAVQTAAKAARSTPRSPNRWVRA